MMGHRRLFNHHKLKRRLQRQRKKNNTNHVAVKRDSVAGGFTGRNPYTRGIFGSRRRYLDIGLLIAAVGIFAGVYFFHPFFHIQNIRVEGLRRVNPTAFEQTIRGIIMYKKFWVLPAQSYALVSPEEISTILKEKYPIESLRITKRFPHELQVDVQEKISTIIYDNGIQYGYLDGDGYLVELIRAVGEDEWRTQKEIATTTLADGTLRTEERILSREHVPPIDLIIGEMGEYPIIVHLQENTYATGSPVLSPNVSQHTITWYTLLEQHTDIPFGYMLLTDVERHAILQTREGWGIKINIMESPENQFERLLHILDRVNRSNISYIDVRFPDRVYWQ